MNKEDLEKLVVEIKNELAKDEPEYNFFKTDSGIRFQDEFKELMDYVSYNNIIPKFLGSLSVFYEFLMNLVKTNLSNSHQVKYQFLENDKILEEKIYIGDEILELFPDLSNEFKLFKKRELEIKRMNAYYFLAFFSYFDHYSKKLYRAIISRYCANHSFKLFDSSRPKSRPKELIVKIKRELELDKDSILTKNPSSKLWYDNYKALIDIRHKFAHNAPEARHEILDKFFSETIKDAKDEIKILFEKSRVEENQNIDLLDTVEKNFKSSFETLYTLTKIGKDCYGYLALIDNLVSDYFTKHK